MNKILIIDDDRELCALIKRSVQAENIEADFCNTGKEGLQKLREQEYQLVVLDVMMPGMDGFETLEEIRKENSLPILMFTSKNDSASKVRGLRAGADDYLTKPFDMDELIARIASLIRRYTRFNHQAGAVQGLRQVQAQLPDGGHFRRDPYAAHDRQRKVHPLRCVLGRVPVRRDRRY